MKENKPQKSKGRANILICPNCKSQYSLTEQYYAIRKERGRCIREMCRKKNGKGVKLVPEVEFIRKQKDRRVETKGIGPMGVEKPRVPGDKARERRGITREKIKKHNKGNT